MKDWKAPLRCRPYGKLEALNNQPEIHDGNEEYWNQKRRSVVPPKVSCFSCLKCRQRFLSRVAFVNMSGWMNGEGDSQWCVTSCSTFGVSAEGMLNHGCPTCYPNVEVCFRCALKSSRPPRVRNIVVGSNSSKDGEKSGTCHAMKKIGIITLMDFLPTLKDIARGGAARCNAGHSHEHTTTTSTMLHSLGYTASIGTINSADTFSSWGALDDAAVVRVSAVSATAFKQDKLNQWYRSDRHRVFDFARHCFK